MVKIVSTALILFLSVAVAAEESAKTDAEKKADKNKVDSTVKLESVFVGDKEQPAISYFIPWQGIGTPDKLHWNVEDKHDKALDLVDREILLRSIYFYGEMQLENPSKAVNTTTNAGAE